MSVPWIDCRALRAGVRASVRVGAKFVWVPPLPGVPLSSMQPSYCPACATLVHHSDDWWLVVGALRLVCQRLRWLLQAVPSSKSTTPNPQPRVLNSNRLLNREGWSLCQENRHTQNLQTAEDSQLMPSKPPHAPWDWDWAKKLRSAVALLSPSPILKRLPRAPSYVLACLFSSLPDLICCYITKYTPISLTN